MKRYVFSLLFAMSMCGAASAAPDPSPVLKHGILSKTGMALVQKAHGFVWGSPRAQAKAIVFFDPNCIWCHRFFLQAERGVATGKARYLMIPVAILKKSSLPKAERIILAKVPEKAFLRNEKGFDESTEEGALPKTFPQSKKRVIAGKLIAINTAILADLEGGRPATPSFIVFTPHGSALREGTPVMGSNFRQGLIPVPPAHPIVLPTVPRIEE